MRTPRVIGLFAWRAGKWLASYADIAEYLHEAVPRDARVLVVGCGNSGLSADMYDDGYRRVCVLLYFLHRPR